MSVLQWAGLAVLLLIIIIAGIAANVWVISAVAERTCG